MGYFGLTGGIASGKTTTAQVFAELGAKVIDADRLGHEVIRAPGGPYQQLIREFGDEVLDSNGEIDRTLLGRIVFGDPEKLLRLNAIVHPRIIARTDELAAEYEARGPKAVIMVDAALIFEAGIGGRFQKIVVVWCRPELQLERLMAKTGMARTEAERRIAAQMPAEEKRRRADYVIDSSGSLEDMRRQVEAVYSELKRITSGTAHIPS
jgi:dephospho-CoA kinase